MTNILFFAKNIKHLRKISGYSQEIFARELGVKRTTISNYESGLSSPDFNTLIKIARIFDINIDELLTKDLTAVAMGGGCYKSSEDRIISEKRMVHEPNIAYNVQKECQFCKQKDKTIELLQESLRQANQMLENYSRYQQQLIETVEMLKKQKT